MDRQNLVEIKKGQTGHGLIIDTDGYISLTEGENKKLFESIIKESEEHEFHCPNPFIVNAVFQKYGIQNANGRIYPESVLRKQVEVYQQKINERRAYGELNHPDEVSIDLGRIALNIIELHWEGHTLVGKLEVVTSEGFRRTGICSTIGDQAANLLLNGLKIGVSSRGIGSVEQRMGSLIVGDDYEIVCWDFVSDPSTPQAWVAGPGEEVNPMWVESKQTNKPVLAEDKKLKELSKFDNWLLG